MSWRPRQRRYGSGGGSLSLDFTSSMPAEVTVTSSPAGFATTVAGTLTSFSANAGRRTDAGLLIEPASTNLWVRSQTLDNATWIKSATTTSTDNTNAPDGTATAERFLETTANAMHYILAPSFFTVAATAFTASFYVKAINGRDCAIYFNGASASPSCYLPFTLSGAGAVGAKVDVAAGFGAVTGEIEALANSWYRVTIHITSVNGEMQGLLLTFAGGRTFVGDVTKGFYVWGAQLEQSTTLSSYITTVASSVLRAADNVGFTIPAGITSLLYTFDNNTTQTVSVSPGAYSIPTTLNRRQIKTIVGS